MKIMIVTGEKTSSTCLEMIRKLGPSQAYHYTYVDGKFAKDLDFENDQKYFDAVYSPDPSILLKLKLKIPYFYDIPSGHFKHDLDYNCFYKKYAQLGGAQAVFVNDKKMSRYAHWAGLNPFWAREGISLEDTTFIQKDFESPKLRIGFLNDSESDYKIVKDVFFAKKDNWEFHIYNASDLKQDGSLKFYNGNKDLAKKEVYLNSHVILNPGVPTKNTVPPTPSVSSLEAMLLGCIPITGNMHDNEDCVMFDKYHYLKLDFIDANTILETLRYADKRREKLYRMSKEGRKLVYKYFDSKESANQKISIISKYI